MSEFVLQAEIVEILRRARRPGWVFFHPPNGEERTKRVDPRTGKLFCPGGTKLQLMGIRKGVPDLILIAPPQGRVHGLEIKAEGGPLSPEQVAFGKELEAAGGVYAAVWSREGALDLLERWGTVRRA